VISGRVSITTNKSGVFRCRLAILFILLVVVVVVVVAGGRNRGGGALRSNGFEVEVEVEGGGRGSGGSDGSVSGGGGGSGGLCHGRDDGRLRIVIVQATAGRARRGRVDEKLDDDAATIDIGNARRFSWFYGWFCVSAAAGHVGVDARAAAGGNR
jgi:hypothetical protein